MAQPQRFLCCPEVSMTTEKGAVGMVDRLSRMMRFREKPEADSYSGHRTQWVLGKNTGFLCLL